MSAGERDQTTTLATNQAEIFEIKKEAFVEWSAHPGNVPGRLATESTSMKSSQQNLKTWNSLFHLMQKAAVEACSIELVGWCHLVAHICALQQLRKLAPSAFLRDITMSFVVLLHFGNNDTLSMYEIPETGFLRYHRS